MNIIRQHKKGYKVIAILLAKDWYPSQFFESQIYIQRTDFVVVEFNDYGEEHNRRYEGLTTLTVCKTHELADISFKYLTKTLREKKLERIIE